MNNTPFFSVVIPTCNRPDLLSVCLESLKPGKQTLDISNYEVIVTDDSKTLNVKHLLEKYPWAKYLSGPGKGPAANRNNGARYSQGKWIAFIDDDCIADKEWLESFYIFHLKNKNVKILEGRTYVDQLRKSLSEVAPLNPTGGYLWSCNFAIEAMLFQSIGGFNDVFPFAAMEDVDLRSRISKAGHSFQFVSAASVQHPWRERGGWKKLKQAQQSTLIYLSLHPEESISINSKYYLEKTIRHFFKNTLPGIFQYRFRGFLSALQEHLADIQMIFLLLKKNNPNQHS